MVTRRRINLSLADRDFERVADLARSEGKTPSTFVADMVKAALWHASKRPSKPPEKAQEAISSPVEGVGAGMPGKAPVKPAGLSWGQWKKAQKQAKKKGSR